MSGSYIFLIHFVGFSLLSAVVIGGWILNSRFIGEKDLALKLFLGMILRIFGLLSPVAALILLVSGIGNIYNLYGGTPIHWYEQGWLVIKIILFGVMVVNGSLFGPLMSRKRLKAVQKMVESGESEEDLRQLRDLNTQMRWFYVVQSVLLIGITFFSVFGTSKHPGFF